ncbi:unnamed protein product [Diabrotica balteata]|uniref:Uncharacterized protein n=1 Tax=Diabrotica balteata TaxID=107213 RepID=A0A9N9XFM6_DIABA|nr:unnamed protein product [Diabrotica balteata]
MEFHENITDSKNEHISTCIKNEGDCLKEYHEIEIKSEVKECYFETSNPQYFSDDIKIENNMLEDVTNEIKVEIKKELEDHGIGIGIKPEVASLLCDATAGEFYEAVADKKIISHIVEYTNLYATAATFGAN